LNKFEGILQELDAGQVIQESSTNLMSFLVNDFIDLAQIKNNKFRKNIQQFDIRDAIEEVMSVQRLAANEKDIDF
jgi:signal transduction histidine kinase